MTTQEYLAQHPDLQANWDSDPGYAEVYGSLENYVLSHMASWDKPVFIDWANENSDHPILTDSFLSQNGIESEGGGIPETMPAQQALTNEVLNRAGTLIGGDEDRTQDAADIIASYGPVLQGVRETIGSTLNGGLLNSEIEASRTAQRAQQAGLGQMTGSLNANLADNVAARRANLDSYVADESRALAQNYQTLTANLASEVASRNANLATALAAMRGNLSGELATKAAALEQQLAALQQGISTFSAAEIVSLERQVAANFESLSQEMETRRASLQQALATMGQSVNEYDAARRAAVEQEVAQLHEAQAPLNAARIESAQTVASAANMGAQAEMDRIAADSALSGFIGSSTGEQMAVARAAIDGRQRAALALGDAKVSNASDTASIGKYGATRRAGVTDDVAGLRRDVGFYGATETRSNEDYGANQKRLVSDYGAAGRRDIDKNGNAMQFDLTKFGSGEKRGLSDYGAEMTRALGDYGATESRTIGDYSALQTRTIDDKAADNWLQLQSVGNTEKRNLGDFSADSSRAISDNNATEARGIDDTAAARELSFFSNDVARRLNSLSLPSAGVSQEFAIRSAADQYGNSGLNAGLDLIDRVRINPTGAPSQIVIPTQPNTAMGTGLQNLGAGMMDLSASMIERNYWKPSGVGEKTTYADFIKNNPNSSAATYNNNPYG